MSGPSPPNNPALGIICIVLGMTAITVNDMLIKLLSDGYPLHQIVFLRSIIAVAFSLGMVQLEGGWKILRTDKPFWHLARGLLLVVSNLSFFAALVVQPLADATALFFVAPLFITLLSIPILGEKVGIRRISAVLVGFAGVLVMQRPWESGGSDKLVMLFPVLAAFTYALCQILARRHGGLYPRHLYRRQYRLLCRRGGRSVCRRGRKREPALPAHAMALARRQRRAFVSVSGAVIRRDRLFHIPGLPAGAPRHRGAV